MISQPSATALDATARNRSTQDLARLASVKARSRSGIGSSAERMECSRRSSPYMSARSRRSACVNGRVLTSPTFAPNGLVLARAVSSKPTTGIRHTCRHSDRAGSWMLPITTAAQPSVSASWTASSTSAPAARWKARCCFRARTEFLSPFTSTSTAGSSATAADTSLPTATLYPRVSSGPKDW